MPFIAISFAALPRPEADICGSAKVEHKTIPKSAHSAYCQSRTLSLERKLQLFLPQPLVGKTKRDRSLFS